MGDWIGFLAIAALATRVGGGSPETAVGLVMAARIVPGFFLGPVAGVLVDRWDRKKVMVACDLGRAATLAAAAVRRPRVAAAHRLARARDLHPAVVAGQGGVGPEPGAAGTA